MEQDELLEALGLSSDTSVNKNPVDMEDVLVQRNRLTDVINSLENPTFGLTGSGPLESLLFGSSDTEGVSDDAPNAFQRVGRQITNAISPDLNRARTSLQYLEAKDYVKAYESLKGAGQITEYEGRTAAKAESIFNQATANDSDMRQEAQRYLDGIDFGIARGNLGVTIDDNGVETRTDEFGNTVYGVTYRDTDGQIKFKEVGDEANPVHNIPAWLTEEQAKQFRNSLGDTAVYFYNGRIYNDQTGRFSK